MFSAIRRCTRIAFFLIGLFCLPYLPCFAFAEGSAFDMSLEELMSVEVTSASKKPQQLKDIPAAVHIISAEDIRRSGATSIPEVLMLAPGVQVLAVSHNRWSISIRGGAREYSNKLLVMVDGRNVYSPTFSGAFWEALEVPLENILRIEVIRGPGASIWGSNAVNGVINILTKSASETKDGLVVLAAGNKLRDSAFLRYGYQHSEDTSVRFHARGFEFNQSRQPDGLNGEDAWSNRSAGFRADRNPADGRQKFMLQGNAFISRADDYVEMYSRPPSIENILYTQQMQGVNLTARWENDDARDHHTTLQTSFENTQLHHIYIDERRSTFDLEYTDRFKPRRRHELVWGVSTRLSYDKTDSSRYVRMFERTKLTKLYRLFFNDEITLRPDRLTLSLSAGIEHNQYTGYEFQPSLRLILTPDPKTSIWLALSRASRTPSRLERGSGFYTQAGLGLPFPFVVDVLLDGLDSEKLDSADLGWRRKFNSRLSMDLSGFYFKYRDVAGSNQTGTVFDPAGYAVVNYQLNNLSEADFRGLELSLDWQPLDRWHLQGAYSLININLAIPADSLATDINKNVPTRIYSVFSKVDLSNTMQWDAWYRHTGANERGNLSAYDIVDSRLAWRARSNLELSLVCQNMFDKKHQEVLAVYSKQHEFGRKIYFKSEWSF